MVKIVRHALRLCIDIPSRVTHIEGMANAIAATGYRVEPEAAMRDFSKSTLAALADRGIRVVGLTVIPSDGDLPFATGSRGYRVDDNGCGRIWTFAQVKGAAQ